MSHGRKVPTTLHGWKSRRRILVEELKTTRNGAAKKQAALARVDAAIARLEKDLGVPKAEHSEFCVCKTPQMWDVVWDDSVCQKCGKSPHPKGADPAFWKRLKEESKRIGWRGEYSVVKYLRRRGWFAKRSYGSWGVDVFASRMSGWIDSKHSWVCISLLIDVKSSDSWTAEALRAKPIDPGVFAESKRTGIPVVRAACVKSKQPVFFWESGERIDPKWFE